MNAPPQMKSMFEVLTCINSCWGCFLPPCGGMFAVVPSIILSKACCTPSRRRRVLLRVFLIFCLSCQPHLCKLFPAAPFQRHSLPPGRSLRYYIFNILSEHILPLWCCCICHCERHIKKPCECLCEQCFSIPVGPIRSMLLLQFNVCFCPGFDGINPLVVIVHCN